LMADGDVDRSDPPTHKDGRVLLSTEAGEHGKPALGQSAKAR
jgi:hypothetical protein